MFRLTRLAVSDTFPPVQRARHAYLQRFPADSWQVDLGTCPWCMSFWIALGVLAVRRRVWWRSVAAPALAASAVTGILAEQWS